MWIIAHPSLFNSAPKSFTADVECLIVDELVDKAALRGVGPNERITLALEELVEGATPLPPPEKMSAYNIKRLEKLRTALWKALHKAKMGPVRAATLRKHGVTAYDAGWAAKVERRRIYRGPDPSFAESNRNFKAMQRMWTAVAALLRENGPEASGRLTLTRDEATKIRELQITGYEKIYADYCRPTLLIDAALDAQRIRPMFPQIRVVDELLVDAPFLTVKKSVGRSGAKAMLLPLKTRNKGDGFAKEEEAENLTRSNNRYALRTNLINLARRNKGKKVLVVTYKDLIELLPDLPANVETANFNALAGRDRWADFDVAVIIGRPLPPPWAVEAISGAVTGRAAEKAEHWYEKRPAQHIVRRGDGFVGVAEQAAHHPDDMADRHRRRICEMEIEQAIGRLRGVRRTAEKKAEVIVVNDCVLGSPVDELFDANLFFRATPQDRMYAEGGICFESAADAFKAYPQLWPSAEAAKKALHRSESSGTFSYKGFLL